MRRLTAVVLLLCGSSCEDMMIIEYGRAQGVLPMTYAQTITGLPANFTPEEWPDGTIVLEGAGDGDDVRLVVDTLPDGGRRITMSKELPLLGAEAAIYYRDLFGEDRIRAIKGVDLQVVSLDVEDVDLEITGPPVVAAAGVPLSTSRVSVSDEILLLLREKLIAGEEIRVPVSLTFELGPDALTALPPRRLHVDMTVQPTLYIHLLEAI
jgi:hypothetical protein